MHYQGGRKDKLNNKLLKPENMFQVFIFPKEVFVFIFSRTFIVKRCNSASLLYKLCLFFKNYCVRFTRKKLDF